MNREEFPLPGYQDDKAGAHTIIDRKALMVRLNNDIDLLRELIDFFLQDYHRLLTEIESALAMQDARTLRIAAHTLKGNFGNFCANKAYELSYHIETAALEENFAAAASVFSALKEELKRVDRALRLLSEEYAA